MRQPGEHTVGSTSGLCNEEKVQNELFYGKLAAMSDSSVPPLPTVEDVLADLLQLRKGLGKLTVHKLVGREALIQLCGDGDIMDAYIGLKRDLERCTRSNKHEAAAAWSILADHETVMDRLVATAELLAVDGKDAKDQRSARTWSDRGMPGLARDLIEFAEMRGNLGQDLVGVGILGSEVDGLSIRIVQVTSLQLRRRAPLVSVTRLREADLNSSESFDLEAIEPESHEVDDTHDTRLHTVRLAIEPDRYLIRGPLVSIEVSTRHTRTPTYFFEDHTTFGRSVQLTLSTSRTLASVSVSVT